MQSRLSDKELGMDRRITRRDFMNGAALAIGAAVVSPHVFGQGAPGASGGAVGKAAYPPSSTGLRGCHTGAYETMHAVRDGSFWKSAAQPEDTGEKYDLVIVGGGISGLSAARFYREQAGAASRILILENHDDFGGHAKRNEFAVGNTALLGFGGSASMNSPAAYSAVASKLVKDLGVEVDSYARLLNTETYSSLNLGPKLFFDNETFGKDSLTTDPHLLHPGLPEERKAKVWTEYLAGSALSDQANADLKRLYISDEDYMAGKSSAEKKAALLRMSYADYLADPVKVDPAVIAMMQMRLVELYGCTVDAIPALDAWGRNLPGFAGLKLDPGVVTGMGRNALPAAEPPSEYFHFPDGNSSVARLLVRGLIPESVPGSTVDDVVTSRVLYDRLDQAKNPVRIRLNSTVVRVKHDGPLATAKDVDVAYMQDGKLRSVKAAHCILACWNTVIPYLTDELSADQKTALTFAEKIPLVYTNVALKNWDAFVKLGASTIYAPGCYYSAIALDERVSMGNYKATTKPTEPIVVTMRRIPCAQGLPARSQHRAGRADLYGTSFDTFERNLRDELARTLGAGGFDPARDIAAITVNRWGHGRTYQYNALYDSFWLEGGAQPCVAARQPFGRVAIANADAGAYGYMDSAIDQAHRAVSELKG